MSGHDPVPEGLRGRIAGLRGYQTLCLPAGQLRELVEGHDRSRAEWAAELVKNSLLEGEIERLRGDPPDEERAVESFTAAMNEAGVYVSEDADVVDGSLVTAVRGLLAAGWKPPDD